jgi:hypothetical protein
MYPFLSLTIIKNYLVFWGTKKVKKEKMLRPNRKYDINDRNEHKFDYK